MQIKKLRKEVETIETKMQQQEEELKVRVLSESPDHSPTA